MKDLSQEKNSQHQAGREDKQKNMTMPDEGHTNHQQQMGDCDAMQMPEHQDGHHQMHMDMGNDQHDHHEMHMDMGGDHHMMMHGGQMMDMGDMRKRFWLSLILTVPIVILSPMMGMKLPFTVTGLPGQNWLVLLLGTVLFFYGGQPFFKGAKAELGAKQPAMMTLISLGISVAYFYSLYASVMNAISPQVHMMDFFWELASLIDIMLLGHIIEMNTVMNAGSAVTALANLVPKDAHVKEADGHIVDKPIQDLQVGDLVLVKENERVPADGVIVSGQPTLDESLLTGESVGVSKKPTDDVVGGSQNLNRSFTMKVTKEAGQGFLAQVQQMVAKAQSSKSDTENLADRVAGWLFYAASGTAIIALIVWTMLRGFTFALPIAVTVLVIACPHALGLAIPLVTARMTGLAAQHGLLIQNRNALEDIKQIKYVLMDKTGTLTAGKFKVQAVKSFDPAYNQQELLVLAAALEEGSTHPLAKGILEAAAGKELPTVVNFDNIPGAGVKGVIDGQHYAVLSAAALKQAQIAFDEESYNEAAQAGYSVSFILKEKQVIGQVAEGDAIKPGTPAFIKQLKAMGRVPVMLTGDNEKAALKAAHILGIDHVHAELKPNDKVTFVKHYEAKAGVMMVGDGVNDSPALAAANIGVAIGAGTQVAISAADVVLVDSKPSDILALIHLALHTRTKMIENLWWGAGYNIIALPLAAGVLIPWGIVLSPLMGAVLMSLSTIVVAINAMTLRIK